MAVVVGDRLIAGILSSIRNDYWRLRNLRVSQSALRAALYRKVRQKKHQLIAMGIDPEELRLWCRCFTRTASHLTQERYIAHRNDRMVLGLPVIDNTI